MTRTKKTEKCERLLSLPGVELEKLVGESSYSQGQGVDWTEYPGARLTLVIDGRDYEWEQYPGDIESYCASGVTVGMLRDAGLTDLLDGDRDWSGVDDDVDVDFTDFDSVLLDRMADFVVEAEREANIAAADSAADKLLDADYYLMYSPHGFANERGLYAATSRNDAKKFAAKHIDRLDGNDWYKILSRKQAVEELAGHIWDLLQDDSAYHQRAGSLVVYESLKAFMAEQRTAYEVYP